MKASFIIHMVLLLLGGGLAWLTGGDSFLLVASLCAVVVYSAFSARSRMLGEGTRLLSAAVVAVAGPFKYQDSQIPVFLCFIALPHLLAATQALWEMRWGDRGASQQQAKTRGIVFTIAFYASLGLVFLLARGMEPYLSRAQSGALAVVVLLLCLPALDRSHILRLKPALPGREAVGSLFRRVAVAAAVLGGLALLFAGPLASLSDVLVRLSPRWKMDPVEFRNRPPRQPDTDTPAAAPQTATRLGADNSARTGNHPLPRQSDIQQTNLPRLYIRPDNPADGSALVDRGPLYVRTHTLNRFREQSWSAEVTGGAWVEDAADGARDGKVTLSPGAPGAIGHTVYIYSADGYTLPAIQGATEFSFHRVYAVPGDIFQTNAAGDIFYHAVSSPLLFEALASTGGTPEPGEPGNKVHLDLGENDDLGRRLKTVARNIFPDNSTLQEKVAALKSHFAAHYAYSLRMNNPRGLPPLENFLFDERKGHCDFFSSAGALILRAAGVPTRVAFGYATSAFDGKTGTFPVLDRHAHSWTETYVAGRGWAICDFTPAPNIGQNSPTPESGVAPPDWDPARFSKPPQEKLPEEEAATPETPAQTERSFFSSLAIGEWMNSILIALAGACLLYSLFIGYRALKRKGLSKEEKEAEKERLRREKQPAYFLELLRVCRAAGYAKDDSWTPLEFFSALRRNGPFAEDLRPLFVYHCQLRYEDAPEDPAAENSFFGLIRSWDERRQAALAQARARNPS